MHTLEKKYRRAGRVRRRYAFDDSPQQYTVFERRQGSRNWAAKGDDPGVGGCSIRPSHATEQPLYAPRGGYVVRDGVDDPYAGPPADVWLAQQGRFESTYEIDD